MREEINIQWFPGHMAKARRMISENVKLVDAVCEVIDARIPFSSRNPDLDGMTGGKPRIIVMNREDQADPDLTRLWNRYFAGSGAAVLETDAKAGRGTGSFPNLVRRLLRDKMEALAAKGQTGRILRVMVVGIPNVGKSSFINRLAGRRAAVTADRPGVTRGKQWINIGKIELLDTPGVLWPRFESQTVGENLAFTGAVRDETVDRETLAANLFVRLRDTYPARIRERYKFEPGAPMSGFDMLEAAARGRGFLVSGGSCDTERMAAVFLDEFRGGKLGRISLETPPEGRANDESVGN